MRHQDWENEAWADKPDEVWRIEVAEARAEIERLRGQLVEQTAVLLSQSVTIADLTAALTAARALLQHHRIDYPDEVDDALARAQGGQT